ncbi:DUF551 domain-containing protein [Klebsiella pneumoniae]|uniref:DUF551 domain-containing protein n=1 Tax=Klebsiella pneumoniae TaxID=573 RepID=UPI003879EA3D
MTKSTITRERAQQIFLGNGPEPSASEERELARMALAAMDSRESVELPLDYLQGHKDGLEWAAKLAEPNHHHTGDWLYDDPIELAKAIRKGPDMPPAQQVADSEPVAWTWQHLKQWHVTNDEERARDLAWDGVKVEPLYRRAAMLQAGTLTNEGTKQAWTGIPDIDNAINMLDRIDTLESCDDDRIEAVKTVLRGLAGNSPVVPDDVSIFEAAIEECKTCDSIDEHAWNHGVLAVIAKYESCRAAMLHPGNSPAQSDCCPAQNVVAPAQNGDTPAQSQGWIQVSEQMPPSRHEVLVGRWWGEKPRWCCKWATYIPGHPDAQSSG